MTAMANHMSIRELLVEYCMTRVFHDFYSMLLRSATKACVALRRCINFPGDQKIVCLDH